MLCNLAGWIHLVAAVCRLCDEEPLEAAVLAELCVESLLVP